MQTDFSLPYNFTAADCTNSTSGMPGNTFTYSGDTQYVWCPATFSQLQGILLGTAYNGVTWSQGDIIALQPQGLNGAVVYATTSSIGQNQMLCGSINTQWPQFGSQRPGCDLAFPQSTNPKHKYSYVITMNYALLPPPGNRISVLDHLNMAKISLTHFNLGIGMGPRVNHWRFVGIEFVSSSTSQPVGQGQASGPWTLGQAYILISSEGWNRYSGKRDLFAANGGNNPQTCIPYGTNAATSYPMPAYCEYLGGAIEVGAWGQGAILSVTPHTMAVSTTGNVVITTQDSHMCDDLNVGCATMGSDAPTYSSFGFGVKVNSNTVANVPCPAVVANPSSTCQTLTANVTVYDNIGDAMKYQTSQNSKPISHMLFRAPLVTTKRGAHGYVDENMVRPGGLILTSPTIPIIVSVQNTTHNNYPIVLLSNIQNTYNDATLSITTANTTMTTAPGGITTAQVGITNGPTNVTLSSATVVDNTHINVGVHMTNAGFAAGGRLSTGIILGANSIPPSPTCQPPTCAGPIPVAVDPYNFDGTLFMIPDTNPNSWIQSIDCFAVLAGETYTCHVVGAHTNWQQGQTNFTFMGLPLPPPTGGQDINVTSTTIVDTTHATITFKLDPTASNGSSYIMFDRCDIHGTNVHMIKNWLDFTTPFIWQPDPASNGQNIRTVMEFGGKYMGIRDSLIHESAMCIYVPAGALPSKCSSAIDNNPVTHGAGPGPHWYNNNEAWNGTELMFNGGTGAAQIWSTNLLTSDQVYIHNYLHDQDNFLPASIIQVMQDDTSQRAAVTNFIININPSTTCSTGTPPVSGTGVITGVDETNQPSGWTYCPDRIFVNGGGGSNGMISCSVTNPGPSGRLHFTVTNPGCGYYINPSLVYTIEQQGSVKNLFETKHQTRALYYGNVASNVWSNSSLNQYGYNFLVNVIAGNTDGPVMGYYEDTYTYGNWFDMGWQSIVLGSPAPCTASAGFAAAPIASQLAAPQNCVTPFDPYAAWPVPIGSQAGSYSRGTAGGLPNNVHFINNLITQRDIVDDRDIIPDANIWNEETGGGSVSATLKTGNMSNFEFTHNTMDKRPNYVETSIYGVYIVRGLAAGQNWYTQSGASTLWNSYVWGNVMQCLPTGDGTDGLVFAQRNLACPTPYGDTTQNCPATVTGGGYAWGHHYWGNVMFDGKPPDSSGRCYSSPTTSSTGTLPNGDWTFNGASNNFGGTTNPTTQATQYANTSLYVSGRRPGDWTLVAPAGAVGLCTAAGACQDTAVPGINNAALMTAIGQASVTAIPNVVTGQWTRTVYNILGNVTGSYSGHMDMTLSNGQTLTTDGNGNYVFVNLVPGSYTITPQPPQPGCTFTPPTQSIAISNSDQTAAQFTTTCPNAIFSIAGNVSGSAFNWTSLTATSGSVSKTVTANSAGAYNFTVLHPGTYTITPSFYGIVYTPQSTTVVLGTNNAFGQNFTAANITGTYMISGSVISPTGPISSDGYGVTMNIIGPQNRTVITNGNANYVVAGLSGGGLQYTVIPSKTGYTFQPASQVVTLSTINASGINFRWVRASNTFSIRGQVQGSLTAGLRLDLSGAGTSSAVTAADGTYNFNGLVAGNYTVTPQPITGITFTPASQPVVISTSTMTGINFTTTGTIITGSISGQITGTCPTTNCSAIAVSLGGQSGGATTTDANGNYSFTGLQSGNYTVAPSRTGYVFTPPIAQVSVSGNNVTQNFFSATAPPAYSITSRTTDNTGAVIIGIVINITNQATGTLVASGTTSGGNGTWVWNQATNGTYVVTPSSTTYTFQPASTTVTINNANATWQQFVGTPIPTTFTISGTITGGNNNSSGIEVQLGTGGGGTVQTFTDSNGNYSFAGLNNGSYTVTPVLAGWTFTPPSYDVTINNANVPNQNFQASFIAAYTISGTITGAPNNSSAIPVTLLNSTNPQQVVVNTDSSGNYAFPGLQPGNYTVLPNLQGWSFTPPSIAVTIIANDVPGQNFSAAAGTTLIRSNFSGAVTHGITVLITNGVAVYQCTTSPITVFCDVQVPSGTWSVTPNAIPGYVLIPDTRTVTRPDPHAVWQQFVTAPLPQWNAQGIGPGTATPAITPLPAGRAPKKKAPAPR
jgi:hypothetical protein